MINCIVIDDEPLARSLLEGYIKEVSFLVHKGSFKNAILANDFLLENQVDLLFLDIQMPMLTGIDFLKSLKDPPKVIFTTAYRNYAVESYEFRVLDYLLKPITFSRFFKAVSPLQQSISNDIIKTSTSKAFIFVQSNKKHIKLFLDDITYAESMKDYLKIHTTSQSVLIKERISAFAEQLPNAQFIRIHRSYIVNLDHVTAYTQQDVEIGNIEIPIGGNYKSLFLQKWERKS